MNLWNSLSQIAVDAGTVSKFKQELDRFLIGYGDEENISHDRMAERIRWAKWPNSAPISYGKYLQPPIH